MFTIIQKFWKNGARTFNHRIFYHRTFYHRHFITRTFYHTDILSHGHFITWTFYHADFLSQGPFITWTFGTRTFYHRTFYHKLRGGSNRESLQHQDDTLGSQWPLANKNIVITFETVLLLVKTSKNIFLQTCLMHSLTNLNDIFCCMLYPSTSSFFSKKYVKKL